MVALILLFLTFPAVFAKDVKCPDDFIHVKRTPTVKNNQTKDWCLGIFHEERMGILNRARSICIYKNASLSIPENRKEFDLLSKLAISKNISQPHAMDGRISPKCVAHLVRAFKNHQSHNSSNFHGDCNLQKKFYQFEDSNTDPSFILKNFAFTPPGKFASQSGDDQPTVHEIGECVLLTNTHYKGNQTNPGVAESSYCEGARRNATWGDDLYYLHNEVEVSSVICGRHPL